MGSTDGAVDELPMHAQTVAQGYWMAEAEITNAQMRQFDASHDSRSEDRQGYQFGMACYDVDGSELPAVRLSWDQAVAFCDWLSKKSGKNVSLPSEIQWEWGCRAGQGTPYWFGDSQTDFSPFANLADKNLEDYVDDTAKGKFQYFGSKIVLNPNRYEAYAPYVKEVNDGAFLATAPKKYQPNA